MHTTRKWLRLDVLISALGLAGLLQTVYASQPQPMAVMQQKQGTQAAEVSEGEGKTNDETKEQQEAAQLQRLAKITAPQAQQVAGAAQKAKANQVKLENEDGNSIYTVIIGQQMVTGDAANARILYSEKLNQENGKPEVVHPRSSIQVFQSHEREAGNQ